jgi:hypothetical protein
MPATQTCSSSSFLDAKQLHDREYYRKIRESDGPIGVRLPIADIEHCIVQLKPTTERRINPAQPEALEPKDWYRANSSTKGNTADTAPLWA